MMRHDIRIIPDDGTPPIVIPSSGLVYINETNTLSTVHDEVHGSIPVTEVHAEVVNLPPVEPGTGYIVSWRVLQAMRANGDDVSDVYCPDTSVREGAKIIGSRRLIRYT